MNRSLETLIDMSESYYLPGGFHSPNHRQRVLDDTEELLAIASSHGVDIEKDVTRTAAAWHDAGTAISPQDFEVKDEGGEWRPAKHAEEVAAELFRRSAERLELPLTFIRKTHHAILSTNPFISPNSGPAKIVAAADLHGVGFDAFDDFVNNTKMLWQESQWRTGRPVDWNGFVRGSVNYLGLFTGRNIRLTTEFFDAEKRSAWHVGATQNILRLAREALGDVQTTLEIEDSPKKSLVVHIEETEEDNKVVHEMHMKIPFLGNVFSLPDESIQTIKVDARLSRKPCIAREIERVLKSGTILISREANS